MPIKHIKYETDEELINKMPGTFKNCPANADNLEQVKYWLDIFAAVCKIDTSKGFSEKEIKEFENQLNTTIPSVLRLIYAYFGNNQNILSCKEDNKLVDGDILRMEQLKTENNVVICDGYSGDTLYETDVLLYGVTLKEKPLYAVDLRTNWRLNYHKKWYWVKDEFPLYKHLIISLACIFISNKNHIFKTNMRDVGSFFELEAIDKIFDGDFMRFKDFNHYDYTLYYNIPHEAIIWFCPGNSAPQLLFGCDDEIFTEAILKKYNFNKAKIYK